MFKTVLFFTFVFGVLYLMSSGVPLGAAAAARGVPGVMACLSDGCDVDSGPVCAVDDYGLTRTFENRCMAEWAYCSTGIFYVILKNGEC